MTAQEIPGAAAPAISIPERAWLSGPVAPAMYAATLKPRRGGHCPLFMCGPQPDRARRRHGSWRQIERPPPQRFPSRRRDHWEHQSRRPPRRRFAGPVPNERLAAAVVRGRTCTGCAENWTAGRSLVAPKGRFTSSRAGSGAHDLRAAPLLSIFSLHRTCRCRHALRAPSLTPRSGQIHPRHRRLA